VAQMAAEALALSEGMPIETALESIAFQDEASAVIDAIERELGDASGDLWFDWSDNRGRSDYRGRLKIAVTTRCDPARIQAVRGILEQAGLSQRCDIVTVVWSAAELAAAQQRAREVLEPLIGTAPFMAYLDASTNSVGIGVPGDLTAEQLKVVEAAVRAATVSVRVETGAGYAVPA